MNKILSYLILICLIPAIHQQKIYAQSNPLSQSLGKIIPASPDASSIAMYQQYPVDYKSGVPNIEIPLFEIKTKMGTIPFKLSYHIGKMKPSELCGPAGQAWTLSPNLGISRSVRGAEDGPGKGYPANHSWGSTETYYPIYVAQNTKDEQPDNFFYSLLGKSGEFMYNNQGSFSTIEYDPIQITHDSNDSFEITDIDGTVYRFGSYFIDPGTVVEFGTVRGESIRNCWKITEIISYDKTDTIKFKYNTTKKTYTIPYYNIQWKIVEYPWNSEMQTQIYRTAYDTHANPRVNMGYEVLKPIWIYQGNIEDVNQFDAFLLTPPSWSDYKLQVTNIYSPNAHQSAYLSTLDYGQNYNDAASTYSQETVEEIQLSEILFRGGKVYLTYNGTRLQDATLYKNEGSGYSIVKKASLHQTEQNAEYNPVFAGQNHRYSLDSLKIAGADLVGVETYRMEYIKRFSSTGFGVYGNVGSDMWGYYSENYMGTVPRVLSKIDRYKWFTGIQTSESTSSGAPMTTGAFLEVGSPQEKTSPQSLPPSMLKKIWYPTGGSASFIFENNEYISSNSTNQKHVFGAGYRIREIRYTASTGQDSITKSYRYGAGENGSGDVKYKLYDYNFIYQQWVNTVKPNAAGNILQKITYINSKPNLDLSFADGAPLLYEEVAEYTGTPSNNIGKTVYKYNNNSSNTQFIPLTPIHPDPRTYWKDSWPVSEENYRYQNGIYQLASKRNYEYSFYNKETIRAGIAYQKYYSLGSTDMIDYFTSAPVTPVEHLTFNIQTGNKRLTAVRDTLFEAGSNRFTAKSKIITYDPSYLFETNTSEVNSRNENRTLQKWYPFNASSISDLSNTQQQLMSSLIGSNRLNVLVQTSESRDNQVLSKVRQDFSQFLLPGGIYPSAVNASKLDHNMEKKVEILRYDNRGNVLEQRKPGGASEVYIWGYNKLFPVAKIVGSSYDQAVQYVNAALLNNPATTDAVMRTELQKLRQNLTNAEVWTYTYDSYNGITSETDPAGKLTYYEYDSYGRLSLIKDQDKHVVKRFSYHYKR
ncbi:hypothetical protein [Arcticibacter tournemirensis]